MLAASTFFSVLLLVLFLIICFLLIVVVLLQKGRGGGLSGAFGGGGGAGGSAFGTRTGDVFTWVTIVLTGLFLVLAIFSSLAVRPPSKDVATPTLNPPSWPASNESSRINITMGSTTRGARIYYTIDGGEPDEDSLQYGKSAVPIKAGQTLRARAFRAGMNPSGVVEQTYTPAAAPAQPQTPAQTQPATAPAPAG